MCLEGEICSYVTSAQGERGEQRDLFKRKGPLNGDKHSEEKALLPFASTWYVLEVCVRFEF